MHIRPNIKIIKQRILRKKMSDIKAAKKLRKKNKKLLQDENQNKIDENQNKIDEMIVSDDVSLVEISEEHTFEECYSVEHSSDLSCE